MKQYVSHLALAVALSVTGFSGAAIAQDGEQGQAATSAPIDTITVTARKREEDLQQVPLSISAFPEAAIEENNLASIEDIAAFTPGLQFDTGILPNDTRPSLRGVSANRGRPGVALLVDGVDVMSESMISPGGGMMANTRLMDLERIEVVRGPQTVLYGRNAFAGAINYITKRPEFEFGGSGELRFHESGFEASGGITGPIGDHWAFRLNGFTHNSDGFYANPNTGGNLGGEESSGIAGSLLFEGDSGLSIYARAEMADAHYDPRPLVLVSARDTGDLIPVPQAGGFTTGCSTPHGAYLPFIGAPPEFCVATVLGEIDADASMIDLSPDPRTGRDFHGVDSDTFRASLEINYDFSDNVTFTSLTGWATNDAFQEVDFDVSNYSIPTAGSLALDPVIGPFLPFFPPFVPTFEQSMSAMASDYNDTEMFSQEFRLAFSGDRWDAMVTALIWNESLSTRNNDQFWLRTGTDEATIEAFYTDLLRGVGAIPPFAFVDIPTGPVARDAYTGYFIERDTEHRSISVALNLDLTDTVSVGFEGRYLEEDIDYRGNTTGIPFGGDPVARSFLGFPEFAMFETTNTVTASEFLPRFTVDWQMSPNRLLYFSAGKGFKPGGVATTDANGDVRDQQFLPEELWSYEVGLKNTFFNGRAAMNTAIFMMDYTNRQVPVQFVPPGGTIELTGIANAGEVEIYGIEMDTFARLSDEVTVGAAYAYTHAEFASFNLTEAASAYGTGFVSDGNRAHAGNFEGDFSGNREPQTPEHSLNVYARWDTFLDNGTHVYVSGNSAYQSRRFINIGNDVWLPENWRTNVRVGMDRDNWRAMIYVDNLFDDDTPTSALNSIDFGYMLGQGVPQDAVQVSLPDPRVIGVQFGIDF